MTYIVLCTSEQKTGRKSQIESQRVKSLNSVMDFKEFVGPAWMLEAAGVKKKKQYCRFSSQKLVA